MDFKKERNFIVAFNSDGIRGKWNILTDEYIGIKGGIVKRKPRAFLDFEWQMPACVKQAIMLVDWYNRSNNPYTPHKAQRLESLISLGLKVFNSLGTWSLLETDDTKLSKQFVDYLYERHNGWYSETSLNDYHFYIAHFDLLKDLSKEEMEWVRTLYARFESINHEFELKIPSSYYEPMIYQTIREKLHVHHSSFNVTDMIYDVYRKTIEMGDTPIPFKNILTYHAIRRVLYENWRVNNYDNLLKRYNDKPWLYYEDDTFIAYPLLTRKEFHDEAHHQRNCVENIYLEYAVSGRTHIVVVRRKSNPTVPFITCEVNNAGKIAQYLLSCNRKVDKSSPEAIFYSKYKIHLKESCEEEK